MNKRFLLTGIVLSLCTTTFAQDKESDLDPITISTSLAAEKASKTGRNITIIKGEKFAALPVHSVDELLRYVPGIEVQARGPLGSQSDFVIRGGTFQQVLVVLDGVRLNDPNTGHFSSYIPIAPAEIERIEVLKGASSAVYGSDAVGGVIHIITKSFAAAAGQKNTNAVVQLTAGEYDLFSANAGGFTSNGNTSFGAGILSNSTKGQPQRGIRGYVHAHTISASMAHHFSNRFQLALRTAYDDRDFAAQNFYTTFISDTSKERVKTFWNQLQAAATTGNHNLRLLLGYKNLNDRFAFNSVAAPNNNKSNLLQVLFTDEWKLHPASTVTTGLQFVDKKISSNDRGNHNVKQAAGFAILNQQFGDNFNFNPALRLEWNEKAGWEVVPQVNLSYRLHQLQLRGSAGKTIRDADFTERFNNYNKTFVASGRIGNPYLEAERSFSYEAGADLFLASAIKFSTTFFQRRHKNLIDYVVTPYSEMPRKVNLSPTGTYALAKNISEATTTGFETDVQLSKQINTQNSIWATVGFVWLTTDTENNTPSFYISSHAKYLTNFNLQYDGRWLSLALNGLFKKRTPQTASAAIAKVSEDYFVMNAKAEGHLLQKKLSLFVEADNLFDVKYADLLGAQMPGRWVMGGVKFLFSK